MLERADTIVRFARSIVGYYLVTHAQRRQITNTTQYGPSSEEVATILAGRSDDFIPLLAQEEAKLAAALDEVLALAAMVPESPLGRIRRVFDLLDIDLFIAAMLLAPELDQDIERLYAYAIDDFSKKRARPSHARSLARRRSRGCRLSNKPSYSTRPTVHARRVAAACVR